MENVRESEVKRFRLVYWWVNSCDSFDLMSCQIPCSLMSEASAGFGMCSVARELVGQEERGADEEQSQRSKMFRRVNHLDTLLMPVDTFYTRQVWTAA